jgi:hypothetical protein
MCHGSIVHSQMIVVGSPTPCRVCEKTPSEMMQLRVRRNGEVVAMHACKRCAAVLARELQRPQKKSR